MNVYITIDVEEDAWGVFKTNGYTLENISRLPLLQSLFDSYGAIPTYLVDYPVTQDEHSVRLMSSILEKGKCEIGVHCHPWNTPPFEEDLNERNSMLCNLPQDLVWRKLEVLHGAIEQVFRITPKSFRAGRWGLGSNVAHCLEELGCLVDTSITPFTDWGIYQGPDFSNARHLPYRFNPGSLFHNKPDGTLVEIPPTIGFLQKNFSRRNRIHRKITSGVLSRFHLVGLLDRLNLVSLRWLSPEMSTGEEMIHLAEVVRETGGEALNMSFHSTSLLAGKSPFTRTEEDGEIFIRDIQAFIEYARREEMEFLPISQAPEIKRKAPCPHFNAISSGESL